MFDVEVRSSISKLKLSAVISKLNSVDSFEVDILFEVEG